MVTERKRRGAGRQPGVLTGPEAHPGVSLRLEHQCPGIAAFGPVDPDRNSPTYGYVTTTPKPGWARTDFAGAVQRALRVPVGFDTDVNVAALGEGRWGAAQGLDDFMYLTVGTGVGGGVVTNGKLLHGLMHPEAGHIRPQHDWQRDPYPGHCPYHGDCLDGMVSGPAIQERVGVRGNELGEEHPVWDLVADYLGQGCATYVVTLCPRRIIIGGGVMEHTFLYQRVRERTAHYLNGYIQVREILHDIDQFIVPPGLGNRSGVLGAFALAELTAQAAGTA